MPHFTQEQLFQIQGDKKVHSDDDFLKQLLNLYWLRPETALILMLQYFHLKGEDYSKGNILDVGPGDGTFSFLLNGGRFDKLFDVYQSIRVTEDYYKGKDMFDYYDSSTYRPLIEKGPLKKIQYGMDFNEAMIEKAKCLNFYNKLISHDMGTTFPFEDNSFDTITGFNCIHYSGNLKKTFEEVQRVLKNNGKAFFTLTGDMIKKYRIYNHYENHQCKWAYFIDRGRYGYGGKDVNLFSLSQWKELCENAGLTVEKHSYFLSENSYRAWDIGFRVIFPMLKKMWDNVPNDKKLEIKDFWVEKEFEMLSDYLEFEKSVSSDQSNTFHYFVLSK